MSTGSLLTALSSAADDGHNLHNELALAAADVNGISIQDRKEQTPVVLKSELMAKLDKEVKSLDDDSWMFDGPRSCINLISGPAPIPLKAHPSPLRSISSAKPTTGFNLSPYRTLIRSDTNMVVRPFQVQTVIFLIIIGHSVYASSCRQDNYIAKRYFEKYDSLIEKEFDNFIENEIPLGLFEVLKDKYYIVSNQSGLHRIITGEGSHRQLSSSIRFKLQGELKSALTARSCEIIIIERLPSGVFADPFELQHLVQRGVFTDAAVFGDLNLELPSFRSNRSVVEIHMSIASKMLSRYEEDLEVNLKVPLHARYPPLGLEISRVEFGLPDLFLCCCIEGNKPNMSCLHMHTGQISDKKASAVIWEIPCGIKEHAGFVSVVTFGFALVSALLIVLTSISYSVCGGS